MGRWVRNTSIYFQNPGLSRPGLSVYPTEHKINHPQNDSKRTSIGNIEFDSKISIGPSRVVAGCQNDPTNGFDLSNDAGHSRSGEDSILSNNQATNLEKKSRTHTLTSISPEILHRNTSTTGRWTKNIRLDQEKCSLMKIYSLSGYYYLEVEYYYCCWIILLLK